MTNFTKKEIGIIREMMFINCRSFEQLNKHFCYGINDKTEEEYTKKEYVEANKILYKLGFTGVDKDGKDLDVCCEFCLSDAKDKKWK